MNPTQTGNGTTLDPYWASRRANRAPADWSSSRPGPPELAYGCRVRAGESRRCDVMAVKRWPCVKLVQAWSETQSASMFY